MIDVTLYTREGCHLCDEVAANLHGLRERFPHRLIEIDITEDSALYRRYRYVIPAVQIGDVELRAPITEEELEDALRSAGGTPDDGSPKTIS